MTVVLVALALGFGFGAGASIAWRARGALAVMEARQTDLALNGAMEDYLAEHNLRCHADLRLANAEDTLRRYGLEVTE